MFGKAGDLFGKASDLFMRDSRCILVLGGIEIVSLFSKCYEITNEIYNMLNISILRYIVSKICSKA